MPVVGCLTCKVRREVPRWPLPGVACACGGPLSLEAGKTQFLERELVRAAKQAGAEALERTIDDAKVLPLPLRAPVPTRRPDLDPLERTADDAEVLPLPAGGKKSSGPLPAPLGHTLEDARVLALPRREPAGPAEGAPPVVLGRTSEDARVLPVPAVERGALLAAALPRAEGTPGSLQRTSEDARVLPVPDASAGLESMEPPAAPEESAGALPAPAMWIAGYELREELGRSAYGTTYRVWDPRREREVALKVLDRLEPAARARFQRELLAAARLKHPNVVGLLDHGADDRGRPYLALELVRGPSLAESWGGPCFSAADVAGRARVARDLARALEHAHAQGVLHRDVKPEAVLLDAEGRPRLVDLGVARLGPCEALTAAGEAYGTPAYMSPEQATDGVVDGRSDVYSLGATLYRGLVGRPPFDRGGAELFLALLGADPEPPSVAAPAVPPELEAVVLRCLEKDPERRYQGAGELADDLDRWLCGAPVLAPARAPRGALAAHGPALAALGGGLLLGLVASGVLVSADAIGGRGAPDVVALLLPPLGGLGLGSLGALGLRAQARRAARQTAEEALTRWQVARATATTDAGAPPLAD